MHPWPRAVYLHVPFCAHRCGYCDFNSYEGLGHLAPDYTPALIREMELWSPAARSSRVGTIFFGGGTPSLMAPAMRAGDTHTLQDQGAVDRLNRVRGKPVRGGDREVAQSEGRIADYPQRWTVT